MNFITSISLITLAIGLFAGSGLLVLITRLFKIKDFHYKRALIILAVSVIIGAIVGIIFNFINLNFLSDFIAGIIIFFVFHYFYKKYYQVSWKKSLGIYVVFGALGFIISLIIILPIRFFIVSPFFVQGENMSPTYNAGDYLLIDKLSKNYSHGDIIVFRYEKQPGTFFIQRIIGLPGEKIDIQNGKILINGQILEENYYNGETNGDISITLGQNEYFVLGDNREQSRDSRSFGPVMKTDIEGEVFYKAKF
ncbi:MAG: signal peptidase I [Patescibacteria group bacterium]